MDSGELHARILSAAVCCGSQSWCAHHHGQLGGGQWQFPDTSIIISLPEVLRNELGFDGFVVSDWQDIKKLVTEWRVAADEKEATRQSVMAGIDMSMVPQDYSFSDLLIELVKENKVPMSRIDEAVSRILLVKYQLGLFDHPMPDASLKANFATAGSRAIALEAARESLTLLKNEGSTLPLTTGQKILVTGPTADSLISLNNGLDLRLARQQRSRFIRRIDRPF